MDVETELVEFCEKKKSKPLRLQEVEAHEGGWALFTSDSEEMKNSNGPPRESKPRPSDAVPQPAVPPLHTTVFMYEKTFLTTIANTSTMRNLDVSFEKCNL